MKHADMTTIELESLVKHASQELAHREAVGRREEASIRVERNRLIRDNINLFTPEHTAPRYPGGECSDSRTRSDRGRGDGEYPCNRCAILDFEHMSDTALAEVRVTVEVVLQDHQ